MVVRFFVLAVALLCSVSEAQDSPECIASTDALMAMKTCYEAVQNVTQGTQDAAQFVLACTNGEQCKNLWRAMINDCNPVSSTEYTSLPYPSV